MEAALHARDRVGVQDFVLLEDFQSERAFVENLEKRFKENLIYVSISYVCILCFIRITSFTTDLAKPISTYGKILVAEIMLET